MSISIIVVTYNSSKHIRKLLNSITKQQYDLKKLKIIVVDNNSGDKEILKKNISRYRNILNIREIYRDKNYGFASSSNLGARHARGLLLFLNPDTELKNNSISVLAEHLSENSVNIIGGKSLEYSSLRTHRTIYRRPKLSTMILEFCSLGKILNIKNNFYIDQKAIKSDRQVDGVGGAYMMVQSKIFSSLNGFDEKFFMYLEDVDFCIRAADKKFKIMYCPHSVIRHIGGASSDNKYRIFHEAWYSSREYYAYKHFNILISCILVIVYRTECFFLKIRENYIS